MGKTVKMSFEGKALAGMRIFFFFFVLKTLTHIDCLLMSISDPLMVESSVSARERDTEYVIQR